MFDRPTSILVVVAHPDDEVLGCGGTMYRMARKGIAVRSCILCGHAEARNGRPELAQLVRHMDQAQDLLGCAPPLSGSFPNVRLNTVAHLEVVQFIENAIQVTGCDLVFTHHPGDLNDDHLQTSRACQAAVRVAQRQSGRSRIRGLLYMEIPSATDWALCPSPRFRGNTYVEIGKDGVESKLNSLRAYEGIMRPYPHPRSEEVIRGLAACRGAEAGLDQAEAFESAMLAWPAATEA